MCCQVGWSELIGVKCVGVGYESTSGNATCSGIQSWGLGGEGEVIEVEIFLVVIRFAWIGSNIVADGGTGVAEIGGVVAAVMVHVGDVCLESDVGVEVAYMSEGLFPCVEGMEDCE